MHSAKVHALKLITSLPYYKRFSINEKINHKQNVIWVGELMFNLAFIATKRNIDIKGGKPAGVSFPQFPLPKPTNIK